MVVVTVHVADMQQVAHVGALRVTDHATGRSVIGVHRDLPLDKQTALVNSLLLPGEVPMLVHADGLATRVTA